MNDPEGPGLDLDALRALRGRHRPSWDRQAILRRIEAHLEEHDGYVALSGGKDSVAVTHLATQVDPAVPVVWFDSGLEFPDHRDYLYRLADTWRLNLTVVPAEPPALEVLVASGHWDHQATPGRQIPDLREALIDDPARRAHQVHGPGEIWGVRAREARGRRLAYATALTREVATSCRGCCATSGEQRARHGGLIRRGDGTSAYGPIWDWSTEQVWTYLAAQDIPASPVYATLRALGAPEHAQRISTVVGVTGLDRGRITWLRAGWPQLYAELLTHLPRLAEFV